MTENSADAKAVKARKAKAETKDKIAKLDLEWLMSDPRGRRYMWRLLGEAHVLHTSFRHGEPVESAVFREGERNVGVKEMARVLSTCPDLYALMVRETSEVSDDV